MRIEGDLLEGRLVSRDNRFRVTVEAQGLPIAAHLANSGRLGELLVPGCRVLLRERPKAGRKTGYDLHLVESNGQWVSVDARLPNHLVAEALRLDSLPRLAGYPAVRRETPYGQSRFDFLLTAAGRAPCLVEVKSVTLIVDGIGCFPDAVTARGRRHVAELADAVAEGYRAAVVFVIQRHDAAGLRPHDESDPGFGRALRDAAQRGVEVFSFACRVEPRRVGIEAEVPVILAQSGASAVQREVSCQASAKLI